MAGKVVCQEGDVLVSKYWDSKRALAKICSLAIHLDRAEEFKPNKETHLKPLLSTSVVHGLFGDDVTQIEDDAF